MNKWELNERFGSYFDFDKQVLSVADEGKTTLDLRLTFDADIRQAYITATWHDDSCDPQSLEGERLIDWDAALKMLRADGLEIPKELA
jgi:hypothetical protein